MSDIIACNDLRVIVERAERLQEEIDGLNADKRDVLSEAKARGFDTKAIREILKLRKMERHVRQEQEAILETYKSALGLS